MSEITTVEVRGEGGPHESSPPRWLTNEDEARAGEVGKVAGTVTETAADLPAAGEESGSDEVDALVKAYSRSELEDLAVEAGVEDPEDLKDKRAVAEAIVAAGVEEE